MKKNLRNKKYLWVAIVMILLSSFYFIFQDEINNLIYSFNETEEINLNDKNIPSYNGKDFIVLNNNEPNFDLDKINTETFESYSELDSLNRCGVAFANIDKTLMPSEERKSIGMIKPSGWHTVRYDDLIPGKYLYNRCHLIGYQLTGENANPKNLITCTRQMNTGVMLDYENKVAEYVKNSNNHVLYRVTPIFENDNLVASGVEMEAYSIEDQGKGIKFHIFVYNVQDGIIIDYKTGDSRLK